MAKRKASKTRSAARDQLTAIQLERMRAIHFELYANTYPTAKKLATMFEVAVRTITRDIDKMIDRMNLPIDSRGKEKEYFYNGKVAQFPDVLITDQELISIIVARAALHGPLFGSLGQGISKLYEKLSTALAPNIRVNLAEWEDAISFHYIGEQVFDLKDFQRMVVAIVKRERMRMYYEPLDSEPGYRDVDPYGMAFINGDWVMFAYCHKRLELRRFVPPRMSDISETGKTFERPKEFRVEDHLIDAFGVYSSDDLYDVVVHFKERAAHEAWERRWPRFHRIEERPDGSVNLHMKVSHLHDINTFMLKQGGKVYPLAPQQLCEMYDKAVDEMRQTRELRASLQAELSAEPVVAEAMQTNRRASL